MLGADDDGAGVGTGATVGIGARVFPGASGAGVGAVTGDAVGGVTPGTGFGVGAGVFGIISKGDWSGVTVAVTGVGDVRCCGGIVTAGSTGIGVRMEIGFAVEPEMGPKLGGAAVRVGAEGGRDVAAGSTVPFAIGDTGAAVVGLTVGAPGWVVATGAPVVPLGSTGATEVGCAAGFPNRVGVTEAAGFGVGVGAAGCAVTAGLAGSSVGAPAGGAEGPVRVEGGSVTTGGAAG